MYRNLYRLLKGCVVYFFSAIAIEWREACHKLIKHSSKAVKINC
jgi:hypothetical protein